MDPQDSRIARLIPLLVVGMTLNTLGIVLSSLGPLRFALVGIGLALMLVFIVQGLRIRNGGKGPNDRA